MYLPPKSLTVDGMVSASIGGGLLSSYPNSRAEPLGKQFDQLKERINHRPTDSNGKARSLRHRVDEFAAPKDEAPKNDYKKERK